MASLRVAGLSARAHPHVPSRAAFRLVPGGVGRLAPRHGHPCPTQSAPLARFAVLAAWRMQTLGLGAAVDFNASDGRRLRGFTGCRLDMIGDGSREAEVRIRISSGAHPGYRRFA